MIIYSFPTAYFTITVPHTANLLTLHLSGNWFDRNIFGQWLRSRDRSNIRVEWNRRSNVSNAASSCDWSECVCGNSGAAGQCSSTRICWQILLKELDEVRRIRNDVMHFDPDGIGDGDLAVLRKFVLFLRRLRELSSKGA
jgi:hypothetical protein